MIALLDAAPTLILGDHRDHHKCEYRDQVLHDQPAQRGVADRRKRQTSILERAQQDHRTGDAEAEAEDHTFRNRKSDQRCKTVSQGSDDQHLRQSARQNGPGTLHELTRREFQADPEHDQDDAKIRQFSRQIHVGGETGCIGADQDACQKITHDRGNSQLMGEEA
jgi:hypothetical protein